MTVSNTIPIAENDHPTVLVFGGKGNDLSLVRAEVHELGAISTKRFDASEWFAQPGNPSLTDTPAIVLDATVGIQDRDRFYAHLVRFLGLTNPLIFVAGLDQIGFDREQFDLIEEEYRDLLGAVGIASSHFYPLPLNQPELIHWRKKPVVFKEISLTPTGAEMAPDNPLRMVVTSSVSEGDCWTIEGQVLFGSLTTGDKILSSPSNQVGVVQSLNTNDDAEGTTSLTFATPFFVEPGELLSRNDAPPVETDVFRVKAQWLGPKQTVGDSVQFDTVYGRRSGTIQSVEQILDPGDCTLNAGGTLTAGSLVEIIIRANQMLALDHVDTLPEAAGIKFTSSAENDAPFAVGHISMEGYADQRNLLTPKPLNTTPIQFAVGEKDRADRNGHEGGVLWFTGLSGSGKSTLAVALEAKLFAKGYQVFVLDGDNVRQGLTSNLGFSPGDRSENIRRVGEVAALFRQAGTIVISSFISPYRSDRDRARHAAYSSFHEIHIKAGIETCIRRDPKGLYERALKGDIPDFTGVSAPYEAPTKPELVIDTEVLSIDACVEELVNYVDRNFSV